MHGRSHWSSDLMIMARNGMFLRLPSPRRASMASLSSLLVYGRYIRAWLRRSYSGFLRVIPEYLT